MIKELDTIVLTEDLSELKLAKGDIGTVVLVHNNWEGYEVEFITLDGDTIAVATLCHECLGFIDSLFHATEGLSYKPVF